MAPLISITAIAVTILASFVVAEDLYPLGQASYPVPPCDFSTSTTSASTSGPKGSNSTTSPTHSSTSYPLLVQPTGTGGSSPHSSTSVLYGNHTKSYSFSEIYGGGGGSPTQYTTSTVRTTVISTITSCPPEITQCPYGSVTTITKDISTTICPVTESENLSTTYNLISVPGQTPAVTPTQGAGSGPGQSPASSLSMSTMSASGSIPVVVVVTVPVAPAPPTTTEAPAGSGVGTGSVAPSSTRFTGVAARMGGSSIAAVIGLVVAVWIL